MFGLSKAAFKRAMGRLYKERRIIQEEGWTKLTR
jgi:predicted RNA-binding protein (virulence factor B family)